MKASGGNKCSTCGATTNLTADHIKPVATHPELRYDVSNGRILCQDCRIKDMLEGQSRGLFKSGSRHYRNLQEMQESPEHKELERLVQQGCKEGVITVHPPLPKEV